MRTALGKHQFVILFAEAVNILPVKAQTRGLRRDHHIVERRKFHDSPGNFLRRKRFIIRKNPLIVRPIRHDLRGIEIRLVESQCKRTAADAGGAAVPAEPLTICMGISSTTLD